VHQQQLHALRLLLNDKDIKSQHDHLVVCTHYPVIYQQKLYSSHSSNHSMENDGELLDVLLSGAWKPSLVLHGHIHKGYSERYEDVLFSCSGSGGTRPGGQVATYIISSNYIERVPYAT
jgi:predicted phosphodiesterase